MAARTGRIGANARRDGARGDTDDDASSRALGRARVRQDMRDLDGIAEREAANEPGHGPARSPRGAEALQLESTHPFMNGMNAHEPDDGLASGEHETVTEETETEREGRCGALMRCFFEHA